MLPLIGVVFDSSERRRSIRIERPLSVDGSSPAKDGDRPEWRESEPLAVLSSDDAGGRE